MVETCASGEAAQPGEMELAIIRRGTSVDGISRNPINEIPEWMDMKRFSRGQQFFCRHSACIMLALHCSLTIGLAVTNLLETLVFNRYSDTARKASRRYVHTFTHLVLWHTTDVWDSSTPSLGHRSLSYVRQIHRRVARAMNSAKLADSEEFSNKKSRESNAVCISQFDMAVVQVGFIEAVIMYPAEFGIRCSSSELEDYVFFWRGIGYLLGIDDTYNICLNGLEHARTICMSIENDIVVDGLQNPPTDFSRMADAYIDGINLVFLGWKLHTKESVIAFALGIMGRPCPSWLRLSWMDYFRIFHYRVVAFLIRWCPGFEHLVNCLIHVAFQLSLPDTRKQLEAADHDH